MLRQFVLTGALVAFLFSFDEFTVTRFLTGIAFETLPVKFYSSARTEPQPGTGRSCGSAGRRSPGCCGSCSPCLHPDPRDPEPNGGSIMSTVDAEVRSTAVLR